MGDVGDPRVGFPRHQQPMQFAEPEARHAGEQMMLEMIVQSPGRDQPKLPERRQHGTAFVEYILVLDRVMLGDATDIADGEKHRHQWHDPVQQQQFPEAQRDR